MTLPRMRRKPQPRGDTASTVKPPVGNDAPATNAAKGQTGEVTAPGTAKPAKASSGGDAGDTMRMRKPGSGEGSRPSDTTNVSGSKTGETARDIPDAGDTVKMRKVDAADAPKAEAGASGAAGAKASAGAGAGPAVPTKSVDQIVDAYTQGRTPAEIRSSVSEGDIARMKERFRSELRNNKQDPGLADQISDDPVPTYGDGRRYLRSLQPALGGQTPAKDQPGAIGRSAEKV